MIYFVHKGDEVKIGFTDDLDQRLKAHAQYGYELMCALPGDSECEDRLKKHFEADLIRGREYFFKSDVILAYVERLMEKGYAHPNRAIAKDLPDLPFSAWGPTHIGNGAIEVTGQHSFFDMIPVKERVALLSQQLQNNSLTDEWSTPKDLIDLAVAVLGRIDTDPATSVAVNSKWIKAKIFYTQYSNGLDRSRPWSGTLWMNPPYGRGDNSAGEFVDRLCHELDAGNVKEALTCLNVASMSSKWFYSRIPKRVAAHCVIHGRPNFLPPQGVEAKSSPTKGIAISYFGTDLAKFCGVFERVGQLLIPYKAAA